MKHKINYYYLSSGKLSSLPSGKGELTDEQIELLKRANHYVNSTAYYSITLEDGSKFTTPYRRDDFLDIDEEKFNDWVKNRCI